MRGFNLFEQAHFVNALPPVDGTGGKTSDVFHMKFHRWANILVAIGVSAAAPTKILVDACSDATGANPEAIPFSIYKEETADGDTFSVREEVDAAGYTPSANNGIMYGIFLDSAALPDDKPYVRVRATNGTNSVLMSILAILTGERYTGAGDGQTVLT